ncbi:MAG: LPXTG cell wall anchor domain-containing protein, partial [bacterium]|nr:LPXTG cell wall anchor domain-containing protein [bacterium]
SEFWARLVSLGVVVALAGLLGVAPVWAQDGSEAAEETIGEAAGDDSDSADELLAKALELARSIQAGDAAQPPVRVESRQYSALAVDGESSGVFFGLPELDLRRVSMVDSKGNSQLEFADPQYLGDDLLLLPDLYRKYLSLRSQRPEYVIVDGIAYESSDLVVFRYFDIPNFGEGFSDYTPWVSRVLSDAVDTQSDSATRIVNFFFGGGNFDAWSAFSGTVGGALYVENLLGRSVSVASVGHSNIRGHDTTELWVSISTPDMLWVNIRDVTDALISSLVLGFDIPRPSDTFMSRTLAADNLIEFRIWIDESGRVHRLVSEYGESFSAYLMESAYSDILDLKPGDLKHTTNSEFIYLDEDPIIVAPATEEVRAIESYGSYEADLLAAATASTGDSEGSAGQGPREDSGEELADTGANTLFWAIVGISMVLAGAMVFALSRRLRTQQIR